MTIAEGAPLIERPPAPDFRPGKEKPDPRAGRIRWGAIVAAMLIHAAAILILLFGLPALFPAPAPVPPPITVTLVPPPPPPASPKAAPKPPPPAPQHERVSGPENETTVLPQGAEKGAEAAPENKPPPPLAAPAPSAPATPLPKPAEPLHPPKPKTAPHATAQKPHEDLRDRAIGTKEQEGDPYLNRLWAVIISHYFYPANAVGSLGLPLEGTVKYDVALSTDGRILAMRLAESSGSATLDQAAQQIIERSAPFPPPPRETLFQGVFEFSVSLPMAPS